MNLYKVKIETEIMVVANNDNLAIITAKKNAINEIELYGKGVATVIKSISEIPEDWKNIIPYSSDGILETRKCCEIVGTVINPTTPTMPTMPTPPIPVNISPTPTPTPIRPPVHFLSREENVGNKSDIVPKEEKKEQKMPLIRFSR